MTRKLQQPVLLIHGERDTYVPLEVAQTLRASLERRPRLWVVPHAKHNRCIDVATQRYQRRISRFFQAHLSPGRVTAPVVQLQRPVRRVG
jgi:fermentation-respiration switch protein FrsA (DUF1100 family)